MCTFIYSSLCSLFPFPFLCVNLAVLFVWCRDAAGKRSGPGACMTAADIKDEFGYDVSRLPSEGQW